MPKHGPSGPEPIAPSESGPAAGRTDPPGGARWIAPTALVLAFFAVVLAAWALLSPSDENTSADPAPDSETPAATDQVSDQQTADAEARACAAFRSVRGAVVTQTNADPDPDDAAALQAAAANARLALAAGAPYLRARLDPATPPPLATAIRSFADQIEDVAINQLAGVPNDEPAQAARMRDADAAMAQLADTCS